MLLDAAGRIDDLDYFASSLQRACTTMELLRDELGLPAGGYRADRRLMELDLGDFTRSSHSALSRVIPEELRSEPWNYVSPNGESDLMVYERVGQFLGSLSRDSVIVTHSVPVAAVRAHYLGLSLEQAMGYHMGNAGVMRLSMGTEALFGRLIGPCRTTASGICFASRPLARAMGRRSAAWWMAAHPAFR